ncbi:30S ribosomal subunit protein S7 [uncultured spirochete]|jgi:small subunit ribosomal protein S7|uniref:Small ribosomal subunit protein uS7 n=1 Tax=uncultured spirochete TaxID=156406 RepID=A0A3P3XJW6_9SPIR|nr:30S ribosomal protein S7 [Rectinema subterraneum]SLM14172.1 30S ribosomal subunit protein S7 [uncultured spirochete]HBE46394.1 30S ribosomal protein S7 [Spirochaetaceae bacterium]HCX95688.1 30S ribosomal protein S7 [Spirochaetaceae bacterium]
MGRKKKSIDRGHAPDVKYNSTTVSRFICRMMWQGKKSICTSIMYDALELLQQKSGQPALDAFNKALENVKPSIEVKSRRVGGATYQVPIEIRESRREALAMRWLINAARARTGKAMAECLADELFDAFNNTGTAIKKKDDMHKMAEANKAFAHYRW